GRGVEGDRVEVESLENTARGLFGLGSRRAKIRATVRASLASKLDDTGGTSGPEVSRETSRASTPASPAVVSEDGAVGRAMAVIETILSHLVDSPTIEQSATADERGSIRLSLGGSDSGMIIGLRGQTLSAREQRGHGIGFQ